MRGAGSREALAPVYSPRERHEKGLRRKSEALYDDGVSERIEVGPQLVGATGVLQLADRLRFDLANPLTRHVELLADFLERMVGGHLDPEAHPQHLGLARRQRIEDVLDDVAQAGLHRRLDRRRVVGVLDEVAEMR